MPNVMRGTLRVRGMWKDVRRFLTNALKPLWNTPLIRADDYSVRGSLGPYLIEGTKRGNVIDDFHTEGRDGEVVVSKLDTTFAWGAEVEALQKLCKEYDVDMRFYGFESSGEVNQDVEIIGGEITKNKVIKFQDYEWDCICPLLGG